MGYSACALAGQKPLIVIHMIYDDLEEDFDCTDSREVSLQGGNGGNAYRTPPRILDKELHKD